MATNQGLTPPDFNTLVGQTRLFTGDLDAEPLVPDVPGQGSYAWNSDAEIEGMLPLFNNSPRRVAINILSSLAISEAVLLKKWRTDDLQVDGSVVAEAIRKIIKDLRDDAALEEELSGGASFFDVTPTGAANGLLHPEAVLVRFGRVSVPGAEVIG